MPEKWERQQAMNDLYEHKSILTYQQYRTFSGQIKAGDVEGFRRGLRRVIERRKK